VLHAHPVFLANIWAYVPVQALLGALTFWGPKARRPAAPASRGPCSASLPVPPERPISTRRRRALRSRRRERAWHSQPDARRAAAVQAALDIMTDAGDSVDYIMGGMTVGAAVVGTLGGGASPRRRPRPGLPGCSAAESEVLHETARLRLGGEGTRGRLCGMPPAGQT
jgi:hypothetical protein